MSDMSKRRIVSAPQKARNAATRLLVTQQGGWDAYRAFKSANPEESERQLAAQIEKSSLRREKSRKRRKRTEQLTEIPSFTCWFKGCQHRWYTSVKAKQEAYRGCCRKHSMMLSSSDNDQPTGNPALRQQRTHPSRSSGGKRITKR